LRFGFVTCVQLGLACMEEIESAGGHLDLVITLPDDAETQKSGRIFVDDFCRIYGSQIHKVRHINDAGTLRRIAAAELDWLFVIGWSQIVESGLLRLPRKGVLGIHPTLLPQGRGRAAIPWAILKGLRETGVTLFKLDEGVDTGPILAQERISIAPDETASSLYGRVLDAHRLLIQRAWPSLMADQIVAHPQRESAASIWPGRRPEDGRIEARMTRAEVDRLVRATTRPYPGAFWDAAAGRLRVWAGSKDESEAAGVDIRVSDGIYHATDFSWEERTFADP
jgi:methionyl-tRNA formyltransferase